MELAEAAPAGSWPCSTGDTEAGEGTFPREENDVSSDQLQPCRQLGAGWLGTVAMVLETGWKYIISVFGF